MAFASKIITCLLILAIYIATPTESHITCGTVSSTMAQCISYLTNGGPLPSSCCVAVKSLNQMAQTTPDRRQVCECLKSAGKEIKGLNIDLVATLPTTCGVSLSYPIGFNTNCDRTPPLPNPTVHPLEMLTEQKLSLPTSYSRSPNPLKEPVSVSPPPPQLQPESQKNVTTVVNSTESISLPPANQTDSQDTLLPSCSATLISASCVLFLQ